MTKNPNDGKCLNSLLSVSKLFCVFLFFLFQNFSSQIFISEGTSIHFEKEVKVSQIDSLSSEYSQNKIYVSSGVTISNLNAEKNFDIVEILPLEVQKNKEKKHSALNLANNKLEKKVEQKQILREERPAFNEYIFTNATTESFFSFAGGFSKISVPVTQFHAKQLINTTSGNLFLIFIWHRLTFNQCEILEAIVAEHGSSFSVRPPPVQS